MKSYYKVKAKCGHVGRLNCIWIDFAVEAENKKEAALIVRNFPRVKHHHKDAIQSVEMIDFEEYQQIRICNSCDQYLRCSSRHEQDRMCDLSDRICFDTYNCERYSKKTSKNKYVSYDNKLVRNLKKYIKYNIGKERYCDYAY